MTVVYQSLVASRTIPIMSDTANAGGMRTIGNSRAKNSVAIGTGARNAIPKIILSFFMRVPFPLLYLFP